MRQVLVEALKVAGLYGPLQELAGQITVRQGINAAGEQVTYFLNYSDQVVTVSSPYAGRILLGQCQTAGKSIGAGEQLTVDAWNLAIVVGKPTANEV
ncbi:beta-galactosidase [Bombiscardovia coagulans]|uniref:Beta-galactosidase n=2 Tax=Bombiscardovia coagulans TaxID=686666 RepID=A0A261EPE0_9BIFI|nr:beta-galactosidase [Bombiscardovia coagulans]